MYSSIFFVIDVLTISVRLNRTHLPFFLVVYCFGGRSWLVLFWKSCVVAPYSACKTSSLSCLEISLQCPLWARRKVGWVWFLGLRFHFKLLSAEIFSLFKPFVNNRYSARYRMCIVLFGPLSCLSFLLFGLGVCAVRSCRQNKWWNLMSWIQRMLCFNIEILFQFT